MNDVASLYRAACLAELDALKPGNAHRHAPHPRLAVEDFETSAHVSAVPLARRGARVGARVLGAVEATHAAVGRNTNLGIILLCAPLAAAAERAEPDLRAALGRVLEDLDRADAAAAFRAILVAAPGGLGRAARHDVAAPATVCLREAMAQAAGRDRIALQYVSAFEDVYAIGAPALAAARAAGLAPRWATSAAFLAFLSAFPDTHIARNHGEDAAEAVRREAAGLREGLRRSDPDRSFVDRLLAFDAALKARDLNPGTSADLTVATLFADALSQHARASCRFTTNLHT